MIRRSQKERKERGDLLKVVRSKQRQADREDARRSIGIVLNIASPCRPACHPHSCNSFPARNWMTYMTDKCYRGKRISSWDILSHLWDVNLSTNWYAVTRFENSHGWSCRSLDGFLHALKMTHGRVNGYLGVKLHWDMMNPFSLVFRKDFPRNVL